MLFLKLVWFLPQAILASRKAFFTDSTFPILFILRFRNEPRLWVLVAPQRQSLPLSLIFYICHLSLIDRCSSDTDNCARFIPPVQRQIMKAQYQQFPFYHTLIFFGCFNLDFTLHKAYIMQNIHITQIFNLIF